MALSKPPSFFPQRYTTLPRTYDTFPQPYATFPYFMPLTMPTFLSNISSTCALFECQTVLRMETPQASLTHHQHLNYTLPSLASFSSVSHITLLHSYFPPLHSLNKFKIVRMFNVKNMRNLFPPTDPQIPPITLFIMSSLDTTFCSAQL